MDIYQTGDVLTVNTEEGFFQLHRNILKGTLEELKKVSTTYIKNLTPDHKESFESTVDALRLIYGSESIFNIVVNDIQSVFSDIKNIIPGTVAAFFSGFYNDVEFVGQSWIQNCKDLILNYIDDSLYSLNEKQSNHAYIYFDPSKVIGFTKKNIHQLSAAGIKNASLLYRNNDGIYAPNSVPINELPRKFSIGVQDFNNINLIVNSLVSDISQYLYL